ncbi:MAG: hypothetical protein LHW57_01535 [Candidatus Cloacimonetes bacterium]|nr:hypothetical protein [Candidatus Cloacimonadota bacterium]
MKTKLLLLSLILLLIAACSLKRENPLDPIGNPAIIVPDQVSGVQCFASGAGVINKFVEVRWNANPPLNTDGYFVYRGLAYNSEYAVVDTVATNICNHGSEPWHLVLPGDYWYKVSAYRDVEDGDGNYLGRLEGRRSEPRFIRVPA